MKRMFGLDSCAFGDLNTGNDNGPQRTYPDTLSQSAALALAKRLERYWHDRGYPAARFWTEPVGERFAKVGTYDLYRVVCNLVNGLPPIYRT